MAFTVIGVLFIMVFGLEIAYEEFFPDDPELDGHPVRINNSVIIPVVSSVFLKLILFSEFRIRLLKLKNLFTSNFSKININ